MSRGRDYSQVTIVLAATGPTERSRTVMWRPPRPLRPRQLARPVARSRPLNVVNGHDRVELDGMIERRRLDKELPDLRRALVSKCGMT